MQEVHDVLQWLFDEHVFEEAREPEGVVVVEAGEAARALRAEVVPEAAAHPVPTPVRAPDPSEDP